MLTLTEHHPCTHRGIVKQIDMRGVDMVFVVGGNGGNAGANAIQCECEEQGVVCSVVGIPKSIDNDILLVQLCTLSVA
jgi:6-phosphofructokinase 1